MTFLDFWNRLHVHKWGKYLVVILVFLVVYIFIGDQSLLRFYERGKEINRMEEQRDRYREATEEAKRELRTLHHPDSLEQFAREQYYMHTPNEDIYLIDEE